MMGTMGAKTVFGESTHLYEKRQVSVCVCVCLFVLARMFIYVLCLDNDYFPMGPPPKIAKY